MKVKEIGNRKRMKKKDKSNQQMTKKILKTLAIWSN